MTCTPVNLTPDEAQLVRRCVSEWRSDPLLCESIARKMDDAVTRMLRAEKWVRQRNIVPERSGVPNAVR